MDASNRKSSDEIDLLYFFNPLIRGMESIKAGIWQYLRLLTRNWLRFFAVLIAVLATGYAVRVFIPQYYKTHAMMISHGLPAEFCSILVNDLQKLADNPANAPILAEQLDIPLTVAGTVISIATMPLDSAIYVDKKDSTASMFRIDIIVRSTDGVKKIQDGLQHFLENNEFALKEKEARRKKLNLLKQDLIQKSSSLDSLKEIVNSSISPRSSGQGIILGEPVSPIEVYELQVDYYRQILEVEEDLSMTENIEVVQPFLKSNITNYPNFGRWILYTIVIGFVVAFVMTPLIARK